MRSHQDILESRMQGNLARPVWGWGPGEIPGPTPLFAGSDRGGETAASLFSVIATCKLRGVDPYRYLRDVLTRLPRGEFNSLEELLPDHWLANHPDCKMVEHRR